MAKYISGRVKKTPQSGITSDRYQFLGLSQSEPDLGDPLVGVSSVSANPYTGNISDLYVLVSDNSGTGRRYWTKQTDVISGGVVTPGSITVRDEGVIIGSVNQITDLNFVGSAVTITSPAGWVGAGSSSVDIQISVTDFTASGNPKEVQIHGASGFVQGASGFVYDYDTGRVGINSTSPTRTLDIIGNVGISSELKVGFITANSGFFSNSLKVGNFEISDTTTFVRISSGSVGIGTTNPIATLDVRGTTNISGIATIGSLSVSNNTSTKTLSVTDSIVTKDFNSSGISTISNLNVTNINSTGISTISNLRVVGLAVTNLSVTGISTFNLVGVTGIITTRNLVVSGITTVNDFYIGTGSTVSILSSVGIGTTRPNYTLDVNGDLNLTGRISAGNTFGENNQVLLSGGTSGSIRWGQPEGITVGAAVSVKTVDVNDNKNYYVGFVPNITGDQTLNLDSNGIVYNPLRNNLGIGTTNPTSNLHVVGNTLVTGVSTVSGNLVVNGNTLVVNATSNRVGIGTSIPSTTLDVAGSATISSTLSVASTASVQTLNVGTVQEIKNTEFTTTSTSTVTIDSLNCNTERSGRYNIQITCNGQLVGSGTSASSRSVSNLIQGQDYVSGSYTNIQLTTTSGTGNDARANLIVEPEAILTLETIQDAEFVFNENISALNLNKPIILNQLIPASPAENSRVTSIIVSNIGSGYTSVPGVAITAPTNNPAIPNVTGIGSTATALVSSMVVTDFRLTSAGISSTIPTVAFNTPVGAGRSATGVVGFGVSTIRVITSGSNYSYIPTVSFANTNPVGTSATAIINSLFVTNLNINNTGFGYTGTSGANYPTITFQSPTGTGTTATAVVNTLGISTYFAIPNTGIGYTRPPILTVSSPTGVGTTAIIGCTLGIVTFTNNSPGSGYTVSPLLSTSPVVNDFSGRVGMGVSGSGVQVSGGSNYTGTPTVTFVPVGGIGTGAQGTFTSINPDPPNNLEGFVITNPGYGYTTPPTVIVSGGGGTGAGVTITQLIFTNIEVFNIGFGVTVVPSVFLTPVGGNGINASASAVMGIGTVFVNNFGSGYTATPSIAVTAFDSITGSGASVSSLGLGVTSSNISITNPGIGYTFIPSISISSPVGVGTSARGLSRVGISNILVTSPGIAYTSIIPSVIFSGRGINDTGSGLGVAVSTIITTNVYVTNPGAGYTQFDLNQNPIATFNPTGTQGVVGFGVSTIQVTNTGIGYTSAQAARITITSPTGTGVTATASAILGFPGVLPGPGYGTTTDIYYIAEKPSSTSLKLSTSPGIGTLTTTDVSNVSYATTTTKPSAFAGGKISNVSVVYPGSGYTLNSVISVNNTFDGGNVGSGFSFRPIPVNNFQVSDVLLLQSVGSGNTTADYIEYSSLANEEILGSFSSSIVQGVGNTYTANLQFTPTYRNNTIRISRNRFNI